MVRITTWNVNGIRNPFGYQPWRDSRSFSAMFDILEADIVVMQELKIQRKDLRDDMVLVPGWDCFFSLPKHKKGYSGVAIYTRQAVCAPIRAEEGLLGVLCAPGSTTPYRELPEHACIGGYPSVSQVADLGVDAAALDAEGRCVVIEFPAFVLFGVYSPANSSGTRDDFSIGFRCALDMRIRNLAEKGKNIILTGDLNVSRDTIDSARAEESMREEGETLEQYLSRPTRRLFNQLVENSNVPGERDPGREKPVLWDICREFHPQRVGMYTHWEQKINARPGNFGARIDYVLCSIEIQSWFCDSNIQEGLMGSDHCPVYASMKETVEWRGHQVHLVDILNPPSMFQNGKRLREFDTAKDALPLSGRLLPEFNRRRTIKDMFAKEPVLSPSKSASDADPTGPNLTQCLETGPADKPTLTHFSKSKSSGSPVSRPEKRPISAGHAVRTVKRTKTSTSGRNTKSPSKGQRSLKGFFTPKGPISGSENGGDSVPEDTPTDATQPLLPPPAVSTVLETETPADPDVSRESWSKLFSKRPPPLCEHNEPCTIYTVKKAGPNCGRQFFLCARPLGPSGQKEKGTQWRCPTYIWASEWKGGLSKT